MQADPVKSTIHQENIGNIRFSSNSYGQKKYTENDFISSYEITDQSNLNFIAYLDNSLTNYLHQLDTTLTVDALVKKGNYQFSFYIDNNLIYKENLHWRANTPSQKNKETILYRPFLSSEGFDSWGCFLWTRFFFYNGGADALEIGNHTLKIELRPYLKNTNGIIEGDVIATGEIELKLHEPPITAAEKMIQTIQPNSGWDLFTDDYNTEKIEALNEKIAQNRFKDITSIVVIKDGKLVLEEYFNGTNRNTLHNTRSVGKSFASTIIGIAIEDGYIKNIDQTLNEFYDLRKYANYSSKKDSITLKSLLTMSSPFDGSDNDEDTPGNDSKMYPSNDWIAFTLNLPLNAVKTNGKQFDYFTPGAVLLGDIINKAVPKGLENYTDEKLFKPLGITNYHWQYTPKNEAHTAGGLEMSALDFAKYGQLYQNKGVWNGEQILPKSWVAKTFYNYFTDMPNQTPYGLLFWNKKYKIGDAVYETFQASGYGGNKVIICIDEPVVIVITATAFGKPYAHSQVDRMLKHYILPAILE